MKKWGWMVIISLSLCSLIITCVYIQLLPEIKAYGKMEIERFNQLIVSHCYYTDQSQYQNLVIIERDEQENIQLIDFDMVKVNQLASSIVFDIENTYASIEEGTYRAKDESYYERRLQEVSEKGIIAKTTFSSLLNVPFFPLPSLPIRYRHLSSVGSSIVKHIENYGVNHVMVELSIEITMNISMTYPFFEQYHSHKIKIPVLLEIFEGQIPLVYQQ